MKPSHTFLFQRLIQSRMDKKNKQQDVAFNGASATDDGRISPKKTAWWQRAIALLLIVTLWAGNVQINWLQDGDAVNERQQLAAQRAVHWIFF